MEIELPANKDALFVHTVEIKGKSADQHPSKSTIDLTFKNLQYTVLKKEKRIQKKIPILKGLTGIAKAGEVCAIMGASGSGKTSLLNSLSCQIRKSKTVDITGDILANGKPYNSKDFNKFAGYVMQSDILLETLTPRECLKFAANLRLDVSQDEKDTRVKKLISDLKLERAADTFVGGALMKGISGGERKRTSIGVEMITDPSLLFLDEPTSGLDSFTAFVIINLLKTQASQGRTIVFTIHQPSSDIFELFDRYMVICQGRFIYQGSGKATVNYFASIGYKCPQYSNPADYIMDLAHTQSGKVSRFDLLFEAYETNLAKEVTQMIYSSDQTGALNNNQKKSQFWYELTQVSKRAALNFKRNPVLLKSRVIQTVFIAIIVCLLYPRLSNNPNDIVNVSNRNGALFFIAISQFMTSMSSVLLTFPTERALFLKENGSGMYSVSAYFFGRSTTELPFVTVFPLCFALIVYWVIGFNDYNAGKFFIFAVILIFQSIAGNAIGLMTGCMFNDPRVASGIAPMAIMPLMIFSGLYINYNQMPVWLAWIEYISPFYYALQALIENEYHDSPFGDAPIQQLGYTIPLGMCILYHFLLGLGFRIWALINLKILVSKLQ